MRNIKIKVIIFILLIISFVILLFFSVFGTSLSYMDVKEIKKERTLKDNLITSFKINNLDTIYDKNTNTFFYSISKKYENNSYVLKLELKDGYKYKIVGKKLNVIKVNYNKPIDIIIFNDKYYFKTKIQFTNLPLISINTKNDITDEDIKSNFKYINPNNKIKTNEFNSEIHIRGASSRILPKKSYKISIYNDNYSKEKNIYLENFYYGHSFILDSIYEDPSKIRNVLATDIWNEISNDFSSVNINSEFVELFINNEYKGIYVFIEPVNRRSLKLDKTIDKDTSVVIKANSWATFSNQTQVSDFNSQSNTGYEIKYPNEEIYYPEIWDKFYNLVKDYYDSDIKKTDKAIKKTFDTKNYIDIIIFNAFTNNGDNLLKKNNYFYMKSINDNKLYIEPWDIEFTFGLNFSWPSSIKSKKNNDSYNQIYTEFKHEYAPKTNNKIIKRYWALRKDILTREYFDNLIDKYKEDLTKGAASRDSNIWYEYDVDKEIEDVRTWVYNRIEYFDEYVRGIENE